MSCIVHVFMNVAGQISMNECLAFFMQISHRPLKFVRIE